MTSRLFWTGCPRWRTTKEKLAPAMTWGIHNTSILHTLHIISEVSQMSTRQQLCKETPSAVNTVNIFLYLPSYWLPFLSCRGRWWRKGSLLEFTAGSLSLWLTPFSQKRSCVWLWPSWTEETWGLFSFTSTQTCWPQHLNISSLSLTPQWRNEGIKLKQVLK